MFSRRTGWDRSENRFHRATQRARLRGPLIDLTLSNPTRAELPLDLAPVAEALARGVRAPYAPAPLGIESARNAVAAYYARRGVEVSPDRVVIVATTSEAYAYVFRLLADPKEAALAPAPSYPLFGFLAELSDVRLESYPLRLQDRWTVDRQALLSALRPDVRALVTVSPNNPTGSCPSAAERAWMNVVAAEHALGLVADEVFLDYLDAPSTFAEHTFAKGTAALSFTLSGLSKVAALPHLKLSWIVLGGPEPQVDEARARLELMADSFLSVATPVQVALPEILEAAEPMQDALRARIQTNLATLRREWPHAVLPRDGGWYAVLEVPRDRDDETWAISLLEDAAVLVHPGYLYDFERDGFLVVSTIGPPDAFEQGVRRAAERVRDAAT